MKTKQCYKIVIVTPDRRLISFFARGALQKEYKVGIPTHPDISALYGYNSFESVYRCIEQESEYLHGQEWKVFLCDYKPSRSKFIFHWSLGDIGEFQSIKEIAKYWNNYINHFGNHPSFPQNTVACSEIILMTEVTHQFMEAQNDRNEIIEFFQEVIDSGYLEDCRHLQDYYGRTATALITAGYCHR